MTVRNFNAIQGVSPKLVQSSIVQNGAPSGASANPPIQVARWARNGKHPNAVLESLKGDEANSNALWRSKEVFRYGGGLLGPNTSVGAAAGSGTCPRWRSAFRTGPFTQYIDIDVTIARGTTVSSASYGQCDVTEFATGTVITSEVFPCGAPGSGGDFFANLLPLTRRVVVKPNTIYTLAFTDYGSGMSSAVVRELVSLTAFYGGYAPMNHSSTGPVLNGFRKTEAEIAAMLFRQGRSHLFNWTIEDGTLAPTTTVTNTTNLIEASENGSGTTLGSAVWSPNTMGFVIDGARLASRRQASNNAIGITIAALCKTSAAADGQVSLVGSGGAIAGIAEVWDASGFTWKIANGTIPAMADKYDVMFSSVNSGTTRCYAVSIWLNEP